MTPPVPLAPLYRFGSGQAWAFPNAGDLSATPTPRRLFTMQEFSIAFSGDIKELFAEEQFPETIAIGKRKIAITAKVGRWNTDAMNDIFFSGTRSVGMDVAQVNEAFTVPAVSTYTYQVIDHTTFVEDLGVTYTTGQPFNLVGSLTGAGQYQVAPSTGTYTFDSADASSNGLVSYLQASASTGVTLEIDAELMGYGPQCQVIFRMYFRGQSIIAVLNAVVWNDLSFASKIDDFTITDLKGAAFQDQNGKIGYFYAAQ